MEKFQINFDSDLENVRYSAQGFNDLESAIAYLNSQTEDDLYALYINWCDENGYLEDDYLSKEDFSDHPITIDELGFFTPTIDADDVLERIAESSWDVGGEYAEGYLNDVKKEHEEELDAALKEVLFRWFEKYKQYKPHFFEILKSHKYLG